MLFDPARLDALGALLRETRHVWAPRPFIGEALPWAERHPQLLDWCEAQGPDAVCAIEAEPDGEQLPRPLSEWRHQASALTDLPLLRGSDLPHDHDASTGVPGRKWSQLRTLGGVAAPLVAEAGQVVDWCAGKAHLGRALARHTGARLHAVEKDPRLLRTARELAKADGLEARFSCADVLEAPLEGLATDAVLVALHACGTLGDEALRRAVSDGAQAAVLAPCCHHRVPDEDWTARSRRGRAAGLRLDRDRLRLACADASCSGRRRTRLRERELAWRRGLDLLRAEATGRATYRPLPSCPRGWLSGRFEDWVLRMAASHDVPLPPRWDPATWESRGRAESWRLRALGLPRLVFRRALETWLLLDRAEWLAERGWTVEVGRFCAPAATPRNLCLVARRPPAGDRAGPTGPQPPVASAT